MRSLILRRSTRYLFPVIMLFSIYLLFRGHNEPGGGFVGGLAAAAAYTLFALAYDVTTARSLLRFDSRSIIGFGLALSLASGLLSFLRDKPFMTSYWAKLKIGPHIKIDLSTPLFFDIGVYLVVLGVTLTIILALADTTHQQEDN
jgi:multicomponent Na+:H+ antiporter subunit B